MSTHPAWITWTSRYPTLRTRLVPYVPGLVAAAGVLALLFAFAQVVSSAVADSQARHRASAERADAAWRCSASAGALQRAGCRAQLDGATSATLP